MITSLLQWDTPFISALEKLTGEKITECRTREAAMKALPDTEIIITVNGGGLAMDEALLDTAKKLRLVLSLSAGIEKLPVRSLQERGVAVCNAKGAHAASIAEYVLGVMLAFFHRLPAFLSFQEKALWQPVFGIEDLDGKTLLVVGAGSIGQAIARKAKAFDMRVVGLRRHPEPMDFFDEVTGIEALRDKLPEADAVVLAVPLTPDTRYLFGEAEFTCMKPTALFVNISRGDTTDEDALIRALQHKNIAGAALDVVHTEPLEPDSILWAMENVILTPHIAGLTANAELKTIELLAENIKRFRKSQTLINEVRKGELY